ncbi:YfdA [Escherichia coli]|nr:YfdA [Escherichia coli]CAD5758659.1 YfdA [Escherichia coli]
MAVQLPLSWSVKAGHIYGFNGGIFLEHWYAEQVCDFCGWQWYERGELVDVLWGELEWSSPTDDDELPEVTGPAWIVDKVAHYGG